MWLLQPGYSAVPPGQSLETCSGSLCWAAHHSSPAAPCSSLPNKSYSATLGLKSSPSLLPLLILPVAVSLFLFHAVLLKLSSSSKGFFTSWSFFHSRLLFMLQVLCRSVPAFILSLLFQVPVLTSDPKFLSFALSFYYLMHKCISRCNFWYQLISEGSYTVETTALHKTL